MGSASTTLSGPDLEKGIAPAEISEGRPILGHALGEAVLIARNGGELFAVSATCPHYGAPLAEGLQVGGEVRCPWHHAAFDLRTGAAKHGPAFNPLSCYTLEESAGLVRVTGKHERLATLRKAGPSSVVIIGAGAAGHAAAETLRNEGYDGVITLIGADESEPYDRPNISKDYLAGNAPEEWIPLRGRDAYVERKIDLRTGVRALRIDPAARTVSLSDGTTLAYGALLLATGAEPIRLSIPGAERIHYLRTLADSRAIIAKLPGAKRAVVIGASFIGLEVAASLRARGLEVHVVAPDTRPLERVLGPEVGAFLQAVHQAEGVRFHLGHTATSIDERGVVLESGEVVPADLVVAGIGVRPALDLTESAGLALDRGVRVDAYLATSAPGIWAAGDIARWPDPHSGQDVRIEHWVVAQRQGLTAARNILGAKQSFDAVPFFWTTQFGVTLAYVGNGQGFDRVEIDGSLESRDCAVRYKRGDRTIALATINRDIESLKTELEMERSV